MPDTEAATGLDGVRFDDALHLHHRETDPVCDVLLRHSCMVGLNDDRVSVGVSLLKRGGGFLEFRLPLLVDPHRFRHPLIASPRAVSATISAAMEIMGVMTSMVFLSYSGGSAPGDTCFISGGFLLLLAFLALLGFLCRSE